jgi:AraC-like DNA-binding protein
MITGAIPRGSDAHSTDRSLAARSALHWRDRSAIPGRQFSDFLRFEPKRALKRPTTSGTGDKTVDDIRLSGAAARPRPDFSVMRFSTGDYAPKHRLEAWREVYGRTLCKQDIEPEETDDLHVDMVFRRLPGLGIMSGERSPATYRRKHCQTDSDNLFVTVGLTGSFVAEQLGHSAEVGPGDAFVGTGAEPVAARGSRGNRSLVLSVPRHAIAGAVPGLDAMYGRLIPAENPNLRMLAGYVGFLEQVDSLAVPELQLSAVKHIHDLLALTLGASRDGAAIARLGGGRAARLREIKTDIEQTIGREEISVGVLAARHRLPVRYVQRLFEAEGVTFTEFVLGRRLAKAYALLTNRRFADRPIGTIAFEAGFTNQPYFNRSFRSCYGASPSEVRAGAADLR